MNNTNKDKSLFQRRSAQIEMITFPFGSLASRNKKGFTLIEMLVVVAVISILSGLTLTGIAGFTSRARDTRRVGDMRSIQNYVEAFYSKCGMYPFGPGAGTCSIAVGQWSSFQTNLGLAVGVTVPKDPVSPAKEYFYGVDATTGSYLKYVVGAKLENDNIKAFTDDIDSTNLSGWTSSSWTLTGAPNSTFCDDTVPAGQSSATNKGYCISN